MTVTMFEFTDLPTIAVTPREREYLREHLSPPENRPIWIGHCRCKKWERRFRQHGLYLDDENLLEDAGLSRPCTPRPRSSSSENFGCTGPDFGFEAYPICQVARSAAHACNRNAQSKIDLKVWSGADTQPSPSRSISTARICGRTPPSR
jgi:hypothetical protein